MEMLEKIDKFLENINNQQIPPTQRLNEEEVKELEEEGEDNHE